MTTKTTEITYGMKVALKYSPHVLLGIAFGPHFRADDLRYWSVIEEVGPQFQTSRWHEDDLVPWSPIPDRDGLDLSMESACL